MRHLFGIKEFGLLVLLAVGYAALQGSVLAAIVWLAYAVLFVASA